MASEAAQSYSINVIDVFGQQLSSRERSLVAEAHDVGAASRDEEVRVLREALQEIITGVDNWNAAVAKIIQIETPHIWPGLERARALLAPTKEPWKQMPDDATYGHFKKPPRNTL